MFEIGQELELRWRDDAGEFWRRVRVVEPYVYSDGSGVWVKYVKNPGNSFPVSRNDLRHVSQGIEARSAVTHSGAAEGESPSALGGAPDPVSEIRSTHHESAV